MQAIFFALISYFTWGSGVFGEAIVARRLSSYSLIFWSFLLSLLLAAPYALFHLDSFVLYTPTLLILNFFLALSTLLLGTVAYYEALKRENPVLVGTIASSFPFVTIIASLVILGERVSQKQVLAIAIILIGLLLSIIKFEMFTKRKVVVHPPILLAFLAMIVWGLYFTFIKIFVEKVGWFWPNYIAFFAFPLIFLYTKLRKVKIEKLTKNNALVPLFLSTILVRIAEFSYNAGISRGLVSIVAPIAGANPTLFVLLAFLFFKDKITKQQIVGIITTLVGIVLLSIYSV